MELRKRAALIVTGMNVLLTCLKFVLYFFSGSLVILAEAWHSFSDIATSGMVLFAVSRKRAQDEDDPTTNHDSENTNQEMPNLRLGLRQEALHNVRHPSGVPLVWDQKSSTQPTAFAPAFAGVRVDFPLEIWLDLEVSLQPPTGFRPFFIASSIAASIAAVSAATSSSSCFASGFNFSLP